MKNLNIGKAFSYVFDDPKWVSKVLLGGVFVALSFLLIGIPFILGYWVSLIRNVASGVKHPLPEWDDLGAKFVDGLKWILALLPYFLPILGFQLLNFVVTLSSTLSSDYYGGGPGLATTPPVAPTSGLALLLVPLGFAMFIYQLGLQFVMPVIVGKFATTGRVGEAFKLGGILNMVGKNFVNLLLIFVINFVTTIIAAVGIVACFVGVLFTAFYAFAVDFHLYGQLFATSPAAAVPQEPVELTPEEQG